MTTPATTRVIIYSPARLHREAWQALLSHQPDIVVADAVSDPSGIDVPLQPGQPTTVLLDLLDPGPDLVGQCKAASPDLGLLVLVASYDLADILPLLRAGATGFLSRDESVGNLARAIIAVGRGELVLPPAIAARALATLAHGERRTPESPAQPPSEREIEVLRLLARGLTNKDIAQTLILSVRTVEAHLRSIFIKIEVRSRTEAALWAVKHGYGGEA